MGTLRSRLTGRWKVQAVEEVWKQHFELSRQLLLTVGVESEGVDFKILNPGKKLLVGLLKGRHVNLRRGTITFFHNIVFAYEILHLFFDRLNGLVLYFEVLFDGLD